MHSKVYTCPLLLLLIDSAFITMNYFYRYIPFVIYFVLKAIISFDYVLMELDLYMFMNAIFCSVVKPRWNFLIYSRIIGFK